MTAISVYGVKRGDQFRAADGNILTVEEFKPPGATWKAIVVINDSRTQLEIDVKDLLHEPYTKESQ